MLRRLYRMCLLWAFLWSVFGVRVHAQTERPEPLAWTLTSIMRTAGGLPVLHYTQPGGSSAFVVYNSLGQFVVSHVRLPQGCLAGVLSEGAVVYLRSPCDQHSRYEAARRMYFQRLRERERMGKT